MGWDGSKIKIDQAVAEAVRSWDFGDRQHVVLKHVVVQEPVSTGPGTVVYALRQTTYTDGRVEKWAQITLIESRGGWTMTKDLSNFEGPCYYNFPVEWLDELDEAKSDWDRSWREKVRASAKPARASSVSRERDYGGAYDGVGTVFSDADGGL